MTLNGYISRFYIDYIREKETLSISCLYTSIPARAIHGLGRLLRWLEKNRISVSEHECRSMHSHRLDYEHSNRLAHNGQLMS